MIAVLGSGAFGTALAVALSRDGTDVVLWGRDGAEIAAMVNERRNARRLPDCHLPGSLRPTAAPEDASAGIVLLAVPAQAIRSLLADWAPRLDGRTLVSCAKGVDLGTGLGPTALLSRACPTSQVACLTGPSFAAEIAKGLPTALTLACRDHETGVALQSALSRDTLRLYLTEDVTGAELGGALKNVIAIAAGIVIGAGLGQSARAALVARGFAEMQRIAGALGADPRTLQGLSGLGDLVLTASSDMSRNFRAGIALGRGEVLPGGTVEGVATAEAVAKLARDGGIDAPLTDTVADVVAGRCSVNEAQARLMSRPLRRE